MVWSLYGASRRLNFGAKGRIRTCVLTRRAEPLDVRLPLRYLGILLVSLPVLTLTRRPGATVDAEFWCSC